MSKRKRWLGGPLGTHVPAQPVYISKRLGDEWRPICNVHSDLDGLVVELEEFEVSKGHRRAFKAILKQMHKLIEEATGHGQDMEDRLQEYYRAIERLGFKRYHSKTQ